MSEWIEVEEPKVWASRFPRFLDIVSFGWTCRGDALSFINAFGDRLEWVDESQAPDSLHFARHDKIPNSFKDAFRIKDGLRIISPALKDVLDGFNLNGVQLFEVPIHADDKGTPTGLETHFVLNVYGAKEALVPELSVNIKKPIIVGQTKPLPNAKWVPSNDLDVIALQEHCGQGADIWRDPELHDTLFFSDRIKAAIDAAGLQTRALGFGRTRVFSRR